VPDQQADLGTPSRRRQFSLEVITLGYPEMMLLKTAGATTLSCADLSMLNPFELQTILLKSKEMGRGTASFAPLL
jgi:hypothetical protein